MVMIAAAPSIKARSLIKIGKCAIVHSFNKNPVYEWREYTKKLGIVYDFSKRSKTKCTAGQKVEFLSVITGRLINTSSSV
mgnify:CR=1 FL=1